MTEAADEFDRLTCDYYQAWFRYHPEAAVDVGVDGYAELLTPYDDDDLGALASLDEMLISALDEMGADALDADRRIDFRILYGTALIEHHELLERDWRHRDPARFLPVRAIYQLTVRDVPNFPAALLARLARVPAHLRGARTHLQVAAELIPALWLQAAVAEARAGAQFVRGLPAQPKVAHAFPNKGRLAQPVEAAARSLEEFARFLEQEVEPRAGGDFACGREHFERILHQHHFLDVDAEQLHRFGARLFSETLEQLRDATRRLDAGGDIAAVTARIRADHPASDGLLAAYRTQMQAAHAFVVKHDLVTIPDSQRLQVVETPVFLRHQIPFAAYMEPAPNDPDQCGYYYVTPATDEAELGEHNFAGLMHTCVHEAWPGHHLQFVTAHQRPQSRTLPRLLNPSATLYEGWALYCEQLMVEQGFLGRPEQEFILLRDRLWRALRVQLDVELQTGALSVEQAADRMQEALGFPRSQAIADLIWYTRAPGVPMGYATGWALINGVRDHLREHEAAFTLKSFHDRLLAGGSIALPLALERAFGERPWRSARAAVFGG